LDTAPAGVVDAVEADGGGDPLRGLLLRLFSFGDTILSVSKAADSGIDDGGDVE
jgi:hypothetical protein